MTAADTTQTQDVSVLMRNIGAAAKAAAYKLARAPTASKNRALHKAATTLRDQTAKILEANANDMTDGKENGLTAALLDRLELTEKRIDSIAVGLEEIASLNDPIGKTIAAWKRPNGLHIERVRVPLGVISIIYESRPNVTADAAALCLKSGNASILRGGSESFHSSHAIYACILEGLRQANLPETAVQIVPTTDRAAVGEMLRMSEFIDVIVPRGGKSLVARVQEEARVPVFAHLEGICHTYVNAASDPDMARDIVVNAKMRRTSICGAAETLLIDRNAVGSHLPKILDALTEAGCEVRGDSNIQVFDSRVALASDEDWDTEYLDSIISVKQVDDVDEAVRHVNAHGTEHTDAIITDDAETAEKFLHGVNSAIAMHNTSTQYADGSEFGMGAEIGIATGKMHARGPVGVEELTTYKYVVRGSGQVRP